MKKNKLLDYCLTDVLEMNYPGDRKAIESIKAWANEAKLPNLSAPLSLDVQEVPWGEFSAEAVVCINMAHCSPWEASLGLFSGARQQLSQGGLVYLYGPFFIKGERTAPSNLAFDASLRSQNPSWGIRQLECVAEVANQEGFELIKFIRMPANNLSVIFSLR